MLFSLYFKSNSTPKIKTKSRFKTESHYLRRILYIISYNRTTNRSMVIDIRSETIKILRMTVLTFEFRHCIFRFNS